MKSPSPHAAEPTVSVIIAAYNGAMTIGRAIASALAEPEVSQVIVVDDASPDATIAAAEAVDDGSGRLQVIRCAVNGGPSAARNRALAVSTSPWVTVLDADDFYRPGRIAGLLRYADNADLIADDLLQVSHDAIDAEPVHLLNERLQEPVAVSFQQFVLGNISQRQRTRGELGFIKPLVRRDFLTSHALQFQPAMRLGEDYELYARCLALGARMLLVPAQGYISVRRPNSLSAVHSEEDLTQLRDCDTALLHIAGLSDDEKKAVMRHYTSIDCRLQWRLLIRSKKSGDLRSAIACFGRSPMVSMHLFGQLIRHFLKPSVRSNGH